LPFADDSFDLIISDSTLDHFQDKNEIATALAELSRILKPGGTLVITMDNKTNLTEPLFRLWVFLGLSYFFIGKTYSIKELKQALASVGLLVTDTTAIIHNPRFFARRIIALLHKGNPTRFNRGIRRGLNILDSLEKRKTKYLTAQFIAARAVKPSE
jgi:SAM-dependent methyltransferase